MRPIDFCTGRHPGICRHACAQSDAFTGAARHGGRVRQGNPEGSHGALSRRRKTQRKPAISDTATRTKTARLATPTYIGRAAIRKQPSQLWYDVHGNLLGADFSVLQSGSPAPPSIWGVDYQRWVSFREHVHYILAGPNGTEIYGATSDKKFVAAGGNVDDPQAATLVKMGIAKSTAEVKRVFLFPSIWDLIVWIKPNPNGAFADKNPLVIPSANAEKDDM